MTSNFSTFKPGDKVKVTGYAVKDTVYTVRKYDPEDDSLYLGDGVWIWYTPRESASVTLVDPKREALERAFQAVGELIDVVDIREGDVYAKQYADGSFSVYTAKIVAESGYEHRLVYRPEPVKIEAPTKLGSVVRDDSGGIYTRHVGGFRGARGITAADNIISEELTDGYATTLFEGVDE